MARIITALLAMLFSFTFCRSPVNGEIMAAYSVEWLVSISDVVAVGSLTEVRESRGPGAVIYEDCVLRATELIKSPAQQTEVRFTFRKLNHDLSLSDWMRDGARLLVFLSRAKDFGSEHRLNGALVPTSMNSPLSLVNLARPGKYLFNTRFEVLTNGAEALRTAREGLRALEEYQRAEKGKKPEMVRVEAPYDSEAHQALYAGSACYLVVPNFMAISLPALPLVSFASEFQQPWNDSKVPLLIDSYYANSIEWDKLKTEPRVVAVIHKSTIGTSEIDPAYQSRKAEAKKRGYLWGSYHWGVAGDPERQADFYLETVKPSDDELIALDLEDVTSKSLMNADEALVFIKRIKEKSGRYPVLYTNHESARILSLKYKGTEFANAPLWYARFKSNVTDFPTGLWPTYALWQFSSEIFFQKAIPGTKKDMDVNVFNGTIEDIRSRWPLTRK